MKRFISWLGKTAAHGIVFWMFALLTVAGVTYALTYNWSDPSSIRNRTTGNPLSSAGWNLLVGNVDNLNERLIVAEGSGGITPSWAIMAFNLSTCPNGWSEYTPAYGRFIRGIDKSVTPIDPDGQRAVGSSQADAVQNHAHGATINSNGTGGNGTAGFWGIGTVNNAQQTNFGTMQTGRFANETRPVNIALLYCIKN